MAYPTEWETIFTAKNGTKVSFRPELCTDTEMLWQMFSTLSEETVSNLIPPFTRERIEGWTSSIDYDEALVVIAVVEEKNTLKIVASASLKFNTVEALTHQAELGISVHDDYQNLGIGTALLNHMLAIAKIKHLEKVWLMVNTENDRAIRLYRNAGFSVEGTLRKEIFVNGAFVDVSRMAFFVE